jgi:RND family efflux transporter MFP subunit
MKTDERQAQPRRRRREESRETWKAKGATEDRKDLLVNHFDPPLGVRRRKQKRALYLAGSLVTWLLAAGCHSAKPAGSSDSNDSGDATPTVTVQAAHPTFGTLSEHVNADAVLSPVAQSAISPRISAPIKRFYVERGSHVKQGQLLATLENADLSAAALDSKGSYTAAQAAYETATHAQVPEDAQRAELDLAKAKASLDLDQSIVTSRKQLFAEGAIPGRDLDTAIAGLVQAQAAYATASKHLALLQSVSHQAALASAKGQLTSAEGKYLGANAEVAYSEIHSPISGIVNDRPLFPGETATAGTPLLTIMDTSSLLAKVHLAQSLAQRLTVGGDAEVLVPGMDDPLPARISLISPALDPGSTTVEVWLRLANPKGTLKVGTPVHVLVAGRTADHALLIPEAALVSAEGAGGAADPSSANANSVVVIGEDCTGHKRPVRTGIHDSGQVQITSGLSQGDIVITSGAFTIEDGTKVKVGSLNSDDKVTDQAGSGKPAAGNPANAGEAADDDSAKSDMSTKAPATGKATRNPSTGKTGAP